MLNCDTAVAAQQFRLEEVAGPGRGVQWRAGGGRCVVPGRAEHEGVEVSTLVTTDNCTELWSVHFSSLTLYIAENPR